MARLKYWAWLSCVTGVRPLVKARLLESMGGPEQVFFAGRDELLAAEPLLQSREADKLSDKSLEASAKALERCEELGVSILTLQDAGYPDRLRHIPDPPAALYVWGRLPAVDDALVLAVVGTRSATPYGLKMAARLGGELAKGGGVVVSGLAEGCDGAAMEGALRAGGVTVGVLGTAIDQVYPKKNKDLFDEVRVRGALVSEYPPGARTFASDFKMRNRIISGLSLGVVIVEAAKHSGARNTAAHALEQGRDVFAAPGNADAYASAGCNELIAEGAVPVAHGADILRAYVGRSDLLRRDVTEIPIKKEIDKPKDIVYIDLTDKLDGFPPDQRKVLAAMTRPDMHADDIIAASGLSAPATLAALTMLQLGGYVVQGAGKRYTRKL